MCIIVKASEWIRRYMTTIILDQVVTSGSTIELVQQRNINVLSGNETTVGKNSRWLPKLCSHVVNISIFCDFIGSSVN